MATTLDAVLVVFIGLGVIIFLVVLVLNGGSLSDQLTAVQQQLEDAFLNAETQFINVVNYAIGVFVNLAELVGEAFVGLVPQLISVFNNIGKYFYDELQSIQKSLQLNFTALASSISSIVVNGSSTVTTGGSLTFASIANFALTINGQVLALAQQATQFVITFIEILSTKIINGIETIVKAALAGIETALNDLEAFGRAAIQTASANINDIITFLTASYDSLESSLSGYASQITAFGESIVTTFNAVPHYLACIMRCFCHIIPIVSCPEYNCNSCYFPNNCCGNICSC
jgi:hypothetical protein